VTIARDAPGWGAVTDLGARARRAGEQLQAEGRAVRFVRAVFVPEDGTCLCVYEAGSADDVREAARRAALPDDRITGASVD